MANVMVVDDRAENRALIVALLVPLGHRVEEAASGAEALAKMPAWRPDLIVADVLMPGMDGFEMLRRVGALDLEPRPQVLFWTAYFHTTTARELAAGYGAAAVLAKPTEAKELLAAIEAALGLGAASPGHPDRGAHLALVTDALAKTMGDLDQAHLALSAEAKRRAAAEAALRRREQQLQQAHKLEAVGRLASGVAHDFSNLLQIIHACATDTKDLALQPAAQAAAVTILDAVQRASALCRQLVAVGRQASGRHSSLDLSALAGSARLLLDSSLRRGQKLSLAADLPAWVQADPVEMEQVLINLVLNARDACDQGGRIEVKVMPVALDGDDVLELPGFEPGHYAQLEVWDDGPGIAPEVLPHLFEAYFTTKPQGTGLGLATVHAIVSRHGGCIKVDSAPDLGTCFRVLLPLAHAQPLDGSQDPSRPGPRRFKVLQGGRDPGAAPETGASAA